MLYIVNAMSLLWTTKQLCNIAESVDRCYQHKTNKVDIKHAIDELPANKAPGPDGFSTAFLRSCWEIVKVDFMRLIDAFSELNVNNFKVINTACISLLPKKDGADSITDFRPISLIHLIPKTIAKAMATRLRPKMKDDYFQTSECLYQDKEHPRQLHVCS